MNKLIYLTIPVLFIANCVSGLTSEQEKIHPPVNLTITLKTTPFSFYEIKFQSDNRETGFTGYRLFQGSSAQAAESAYETLADAGTVPTAESDAYFCSITVLPDLGNPVIIQTGGSSQVDGTACFLSTTALTPGSYLSVRAFVNRSLERWSSAATVLIP